MAKTLIGIHGVKQSGKNTVASFLTEWAAVLDYSACERGFADEVKLAVARLFFPGISLEDAVHMADRCKEDSNSYSVLYVPGEYSSLINTHTSSYRQLLQYMGTEVGRDMWGEDFWTDRLLPLADSPKGLDKMARPIWHKSFDDTKLCLVTDLRFPNEAQRIKDLGGLIIRVCNTKAEQAIYDAAEREKREVHRSEIPLPDSMVDIWIPNEGTLSDLRMKTFATAQEYLWDRVK